MVHRNVQEMVATCKPKDGHCTLPPPPFQNKTLSYDKVMPLYRVKLQKIGLSQTPPFEKKGNDLRKTLACNCTLI